MGAWTSSKPPPGRGTRMPDEELTFSYDEFIRETSSAWLLSIDNEEIWLPKSQCEIDRQDETIYVPEWLAIEEGLV